MIEHSQEQLITLTADIVAAHVGNNSVALTALMHQGVSER